MPAYNQPVIPWHLIPPKRLINNSMLPPCIIQGATKKIHSDGIQVSYIFKSPLVTFNLRPIKDHPETYKVQVTARDLPGTFKNSGASSFGWFLVSRMPGRNAVTRPRTLIPLAGNAVMMWPHLATEEKTKCLEFLEKLIRSELPRRLNPTPATSPKR